MIRFDQIHLTARLLGGLGLGCLVLGYLLLGRPPVAGPLSLTVAPVLLVLGYGVLIPWAVLRVGGDPRSSAASTARGDSAPAEQLRRRGQGRG